MSTANHSSSKELKRKVISSETTRRITRSMTSKAKTLKSAGETGVVNVENSRAGVRQNSDAARGDNEEDAPPESEQDIQVPETQQHHMVSTESGSPDNSLISSALPHGIPSGHLSFEEYELLLKTKPELFDKNILQDSLIIEQLFLCFVLQHNSSEVESSPINFSRISYNIFDRTGKLVHSTSLAEHYIKMETSFKEKMNEAILKFGRNEDEMLEEVWRWNRHKFMAFYDKRMENRLCDEALQNTTADTTIELDSDSTRQLESDSDLEMDPDTESTIWIHEDD